MRPVQCVARRCRPRRVGRWHPPGLYSSQDPASVDVCEHLSQRFDTKARAVNIRVVSEERRRKGEEKEVRVVVGVAIKTPSLFVQGSPELLEAG